MSADLKAAQSKLNGLVLGKPGVQGTAIGQSRGKPCLKVYVAGDKTKPTVPATVGGYPVIVETSGSFGRL